MSATAQPRACAPAPAPLARRQVLAATLPAQRRRRTHAIDYAGAVLLAGSLSAVALVADLGGTTFCWSSPFRDSSARPRC